MGLGWGSGRNFPPADLGKGMDRYRKTGADRWVGHEVVAVDSQVEGLYTIKSKVKT